MPASVAEARKAAHEAAIRLVPREEPLPTPPCPSDLLYDT